MIYSQVWTQHGLNSLWNGSCLQHMPCCKIQSERRLCNHNHTFSLLLSPQSPLPSLPCLLSYVQLLSFWTLFIEFLDRTISVVLRRVLVLASQPATCANTPAVIITITQVRQTKGKTLFDIMFFSLCKYSFFLAVFISSTARTTGKRKLALVDRETNYQILN